MSLPATTVGQFHLSNGGGTTARFRVLKLGKGYALAFQLTKGNMIKRKPDYMQSSNYGSVYSINASTMYPFGNVDKFKFEDGSICDFVGNIALNGLSTISPVDPAFPPINDGSFFLVQDYNGNILFRFRVLVDEAGFFQMYLQADSSMTLSSGGGAEPGGTGNGSAMSFIGIQPPGSEPGTAPPPDNSWGAVAVSKVAAAVSVTVTTWW